MTARNNIEADARAHDHMLGCLQINHVAQFRDAEARGHQLGLQVGVLDRRYWNAIVISSGQSIGTFVTLGELRAGMENWNERGKS